ncbi:F0F1 ATP synthase subunit A [Isosphaeraceae bacterium EP7]
MAEGHSHNPLDHVIDHNSIELPFWDIQLPNVLGLQITRFMVMELLAAVLIALIVIPLARHIARSPVTRGPIKNLFETLLLFVRDQVARPAIGGHDADKYVPYLWTLFFFVLTCNLLGMVPGGASATGNINVTAVLAVMTLGTVILAGSRAMGPVGFWVGIVPHLDVPALLKPPLWGLMFLIEVAGLFIRHIVLAVRLFANMMAGHIVLAVILGFILVVEHSNLFAVVMPASIVGSVALSLLELFVAFLQAYIFTFLSALFIGSAVHPH